MSVIKLKLKLHSRIEFYVTLGRDYTLYNCLRIEVSSVSKKYYIGYVNVENHISKMVSDVENHIYIYIYEPHVSGSSCDPTLSFFALGSPCFVQLSN